VRSPHPRPLGHERPHASPCRARRRTPEPPRDPATRPRTGERRPLVRWPAGPNPQSRSTEAPAMKIELRSLKDIQPYENNPRVNDGAVDAVAASLREFGFRQPIVVDTAGV